MRNFPTVLRASALLLLGTTTTALGQAAVADASCQPVQAALIAFSHAPAFRVSTTTLDGKAVSVESIYVGDTLYYGSAPDWMKIPQTQAERLEVDAKSGSTLSRCRMVGRESVHGEVAIVYEAHRETKTPATRSDDKIWISTKSGLPLRQDTDATGQFAGKGTMLFTYGADVRAPRSR